MSDTSKSLPTEPISRRQMMTSGAMAGFTVLLVCSAQSSRAQGSPASGRQRRAAGPLGSHALPTGLPTEIPALPGVRPGRSIVASTTGEFSDTRRSRNIPWRLYLPDGTERVPLAIYSPGGGGTRDNGEQYGRHLASHGIASLHLTHPGSDREAARNDRASIYASARDPAIGRLRYEDVGLAVAMLTADKAPFSGRIDGRRLGIYGHSLGSITAAIAAGQAAGPFGTQFAQRDLKGALLLSPSPPRPEYGDAATAFKGVRIPVMHVTGTADEVANGDFDMKERRVPFDRISGVEQYFLKIEGANHITMGGDPRPNIFGRDLYYPGLERHHAIIKAAMLAFFQWTLMGDATVKAFLDSPRFKAALAKGDTFEHKSP
jgi:predicted dienelactone hydrolase